MINLLVKFYINHTIEYIIGFIVMILSVIFFGFKIHRLKNKNIPDNINLRNKTIYLQNKTIIKWFIIPILFLFLCYLIITAIFSN
ncbi:MAG: hypothetical protein Q8732_01320 [Candidatus Phytoplasma australasiaticum]|nr:hypothetical protein [Candidatus Phytoplasma australasiaticum]MDV3140835.1 hypothetical protein [Sweet potato little leaf phytoplasma]